MKEIILIIIVLIKLGVSVLFTIETMHWLSCWRRLELLLPTWVLLFFLLFLPELHRNNLRRKWWRWLIRGQVSQWEQLMDCFLGKHLECLQSWTEGWNQQQSRLYQQPRNKISLLFRVNIQTYFRRIISACGSVILSIAKTW